MMKKASSIKAFRACTGIGIDVSKAELVIVGLTDQTPLIKKISNQKASVKHFAQQLQKVGYQGKLICESTGHYHLKLALACEASGLNLVVLNPLQASKHSQSKIRKVKTDPEDAHTLATMCLTESHLPAAARLTLPKALIRLKMGQLAGIEKQLQKMQQSLNQYEETYRELGLELSDLQLTLQAQCRSFKRLRKQLEKELELLLVSSMSRHEDFTNLCSIPGFSKTVSALVGTLKRQVKGPDAWIAYIGFDISIRESGTWKGRGKLTKRGNAYLRKRLFQAAWGACLNYDYIRAYYDQLKAAGRKHVEAVCMIARKLLRIAFYLVTNNTKYDKNKAVFG
jgi:transposase